DKPVLVDPADSRKADGAPVTITAFGNRLMVHCDDPEILTLVSELIRFFTSSKMTEGDFQVIHLRYAMAADAARVLDEAFNGPRPQQGGFGGRGRGFGGGGGFGPGGGGGFGPGGGGGFPFAAPGATTPTTPTPDRIRVVADPTSNSLLVQASPLDLLTIRSLLDRAIDNGDSDARGSIKTWKIPV